MMQKECAEQRGIVTDVANGEVKVLIERWSACVSCHANGFCNASEKKEQLLKIAVAAREKYQKGDKVTIKISTHLALKAVMISFILPLIVLIAIIVTLKNVFFSLNDSFIAGISLVAYMLYYLILYAFRKKLNKLFRLKIEH
jgi:positive regulator of sigma E activity